MTYHVQRYDCGEWWTFQTTKDYVTAIWLRDNSFTNGVITRVQAN